MLRPGTPRLATLAVVLAWTLAAGLAHARDGAGQEALSLTGQLGPVRLKQPAPVSGDIVTLGDLFAGLSDEQAGTPIARAPQLGESVPLDAAWLGRVARHYQVEWQPRSHLDGTVVEREAVRIGAVEVEAELERLFAEQSDGKQLEIVIDNPALSVSLPVESGGRFGLEGLREDQRSGRFGVTLVYPADGSPTIRVPLSGRVVELVEVPVLLRRVGAGEIIAAGDVGWELRRGDRLSGNLMTDPGQMIGQSPKRSLRAGDPIRIGDLTMPILVQRNSLVTLRLRSTSMTLTAQGRALDEGGLGSVVRVVNLKSNTIVQATVTQAGVVDVGLDSYAAIN